MGKASSAKKIKRVQQAGVNRAPGQRRNLAYPALIVGIIVIGSLFVFLARDQRAATASEAPTVDDEWFDPFGIDICGEFQGNPTQQGEDTTGIGTNGNGLIRIAPTSEESAGANATFDKFLSAVGITVGEGTFTLPDGTTKTTGEKCAEQDARVALYVWPPQANENTEPRIITQAQQINTARFTEDGQVFVLALAPRDSEPRLPPSIAALENPDEPGESGDGEPSSTTAPEEGGEPSSTATTAPG
jgi:hypothetical protein